MSKYTPFNPVDDYNIKVQQAKVFLGFSPTADVVEVVRCKDCKYYEPHGNGTFGLCKCKKCNGIRSENDYCSYGERKYDI